MARQFNDAPKRPAYDVKGARQERLSEYFDFAQWPEKRTMKVTRQELLALLTRQWLVERDSRWHRRLWRWLKARMGSPQLVVPEPKDKEA
jgi:nuclear transport factor 2 (NTF2) superfamily protein